MININLLIAGLVLGGCVEDQKIEKPNVLFLIADDLRPELGCYGVEGIRTPNIDSLASQSVLFTNAYCNIPVSGASRASLLTGLYPLYPDRFTSFDASAEEDCPEAIPISQWFKDNGYYTVSNGKVFHNISDHAETWSETPWRVNPEGYGSDWADFNKWELWLSKESANFIHPRTKRGPFCEAADVDDDAYDDGKATLKTIEDLSRLKEMRKPFFLACGFWRPHLPFNSPKKYWDLYERDSIPLADNFYLPENLPKQVKPSGEVKGYGKVEDTNSLEFQKEAKHGYWASVSYIDQQIGLILQELNRLGLAENTIIVLLGDHGWHLGEHTFWGKHNLMREATHTPLMISIPSGFKGECEDIVEFVDIYPTLCDLVNIPYPADQLEGESMIDLLRDKSREKNDAFIQWERGKNVVDSVYSYTEWKSKNNVLTNMLFDRCDDIDENKNISSTVDKSVIKKYSLLIEGKHNKIKKTADEKIK